MGAGLPPTRRRRLAGLLAAVATGLAAPPARAQAAEFRLGALYPATGPLALLGDEHFRGLELAVEERNAAGGLLGRPIRLLRGDAVDTAELRRLATAERATLVCGTCSSSMAFAATQAAELLGLPYIELGASADPIMDRGFRWLVRLCPGSAELARVAVEAIADQLAPAWALAATALRVVLLHEDALYGQSVAAAAETLLRARQIPVAERIAYVGRSADWGPLAQRLRSDQADVLLHAGGQAEIPLLYRALRDAGWRPRMVIGAGAAYAMNDLAHAMGAEIDGTLNVDVPPCVAGDRAPPGVRDMIELYRRRYGADPRSGHSLSNYVGARAALDAIQRGGAAERDRLRAALAAADVPEGTGANGWGMRLDDRGQNQRARAVLSQWQDGRLVTVAPAEAALAPLRTTMGPRG